MKTRKRPCLTYQIGRCTAPCVDYISKKEYAEAIHSALDFLKGRDKKIVKELNAKMKEASKAERYEAAAKYRDSVKAIDAVLEKQIVVSQKIDLDQDVIAYFGDERGTLVETLHIRAGRVIGSRAQFLPRLNANSPDEDPKEWLTSFMNQYYSENIVPDQILLSVDLTDDIYRLMRDVFHERKQTRAQFIHALNKEQKKIMDMTLKNAKAILKITSINKPIRLKYSRRFKLSSICEKYRCAWNVLIFLIFKVTSRWHRRLCLKRESPRERIIVVIKFALSKGQMTSQV